MKRAALFACIILSGCGVGEPPDPTGEDAARAVPLVLKYTANAWFQPIGTPSDCTSAVVNGTSVRSCKVCVTSLKLATYEDMLRLRNIRSVRLTRANYNISFKRALSYNQPDVTPTDRMQGVWVPVVGEPTIYGPPSPPSFEEIVGKDLEPADVEPLGIAMTYAGGGVTFSANRPGYSGMFTDNRVLLEWLGTPEAIARYKAIIGDCDGMRGTLDQP